MSYYIPILIEETEAGYKGSFPFLKNFSLVEKSKEKLVNRLYQKVSNYIHKQKPKEFLLKYQNISQSQQANLHYLKIDYFSRNEELIIFMLIALVSLLFYLLAFNFCAYFYFAANIDFSSNLLRLDVSNFRLIAYKSLYLLVAVYLFLLMLFARYCLPIFLKFYQGGLLNSEPLFRFHQLFIGKFANLFKKNEAFDWSDHE